MKESVLISHIAQVLRKPLEPGLAIGVHSQSRWQGSEAIQIDGKQLRVAQCDSVLEVRQRLSGNASEPLILITAIATTALGDDVRARLYKHQLLQVDPWNSLAERFKARTVDPVLRQHTVLADGVLDALGNSTPPVAPSGVLTAESVWQVVLEHRLGIGKAKPDLLDFLPWLGSDGAAAKWEALGGELQTLLGSWLSLSLGGLGPILIRTLNDGHGPDAIAVGFALGAFSDGGADQRAMGRLEERYAGNSPLPVGLARQWMAAAEGWAARGKEDSVRLELSRADRILESLGAAGAAGVSPWSPLGFQQRLAAFAEALAAGDGRKVQHTFVRVAEHVGSRYLEELRGRRERAEMAMRLSRWLELSRELPAALFDAVARYEKDGSWVDWARQRLLAGDEPEGVIRSYGKLFDKVTARREEENRRFGELLAANTASNSQASGLLMIEDVLATIVAPLAKESPAGVLLIVMDGMSLPVWRELSMDLSRYGWQEWVPGEGPAYRSALTALPSATRYSRASLLCGRLVAGVQNAEKKGFQDHPDIRIWKPLLYHKEEVGASGADLSEALRLAVSRNDSRVVGVVLNVIDDSLGGPEQLSAQWNLSNIAVLQTLLSEASSAGRIVVLASDHGHVLDRGSKLSRMADSADRWRPAAAGALPAADELLVKGNRVLAEGGSIIAPTSEAVRYTANPRLGYHGGLTAQECVAPIAVLAPALMEIVGWDVAPAAPPDWWYEEEPAPVAERPKARRTGKKRDSNAPMLPIFDTLPARADWVSSLLASSVFADQMATFAGRLKPEQVEKAIKVLADRKFVLLKSAFSHQMGMPGLRIDGFIASLQRILNVEGYPVLSVDASQTIRLNLPMLREQFELGDSDGR
jgi:hypothetical protein